MVSLDVVLVKDLMERWVRRGRTLGGAWERKSRRVVVLSSLMVLA